MNLWHGVAKDRIHPEKFIACIEITKESKMKYELDKQTGALILDRVLHTATHYPANYGFIPLTYGGDNDPLDVLVLCQGAIVPMTLVECYPIGVVKMIDQDEIDEKIIAIACHDPFWNGYQDIQELPAHLFDEITHFYNVYKVLEGKKTHVEEILGKEDAMKIIAKAIQDYQKKFGNTQIK
jgi:inorganic diphosphatase